MRTTIDSYTHRAGRLNLEGINFEDFKDQPLPAGALRSLRYMHDVEHHTVCYLRDLLLTPAHQDPEITSFLSCWVFEEMWHGEAIGQVLEAHGRKCRSPAHRRPARAAPAQGSCDHPEHHRLRRLRRTGLHRLAHDLGRHQRVDDAGRLRAVERTGGTRHVARTVGPHHETGGRPHRLLCVRGWSSSLRKPAGPKLTRFFLSHTWRPVGSGVMPKNEVDFLVRYLFDGPEGLAVAERIYPPG